MPKIHVCVCEKFLQTPVLYSYGFTIIETQDLKWDSLERRREVSRLTLFYKAIHQETTIPFPNHLVHSVNKHVAIINDLFRYRLELRYMLTVSLIEQYIIGTGYPTELCLPPRWTLLNQN